MARELITRLRDDYDRTLGEDIATYPFTWRGTDYEIELSLANVARMDAAMAPFIAVARKVTTRKKLRKPPVTSQPLQPGPGLNGHHHRQIENTKEYRGRVREWANHNGFAVGAKGKLPVAAMEAFESARADCQHLRTYAEGPRAGQCTSCHEVVE